jgi:hypothetical protein
MDLGPAKKFLDGRLDASRTGVDGLAMRRIIVPIGSRAPFVRFIASHLANWTVLVRMEDQGILFYIVTPINTNCWTQWMQGQTIDLKTLTHAERMWVNGNAKSETRVRVLLLESPNKFVRLLAREVIKTGQP